VHLAAVAESGRWGKARPYRTRPGGVPKGLALGVARQTIALEAFFCRAVPQVTYVLRQILFTTLPSYRCGYGWLNSTIASVPVQQLLENSDAVFLWRCVL
jgi:hypothetical protein